MQGIEHNGTTNASHSRKSFVLNSSVAGPYNPFPTYPFTGPVRPVYPLSAKRKVPQSILHPDWSETGIPKAEMRLHRSKIDLLNAKGQEAMRKVCKLAREILDATAAELKPGITTDYLDEVCHRACVKREVYCHTALQSHHPLF